MAVYTNSPKVNCGFWWDWTVSGLTLAEGDLISLTAQYAGETMSTPVTTTVSPAPCQTAVPVISRIIKSADKTVSGTAPLGASIMLSVNGKSQPAVVAIGGNWIVTGLTMAKGDSIHVTAQAVGEIVSTPATIEVQ